jgi:hypothetical protein
MEKRDPRVVSIQEKEAAALEVASYFACMGALPELQAHYHPDDEMPMIAPNKWKLGKETIWVVESE